MIASVLLLLTAQSDTFGKTDAQILAMGRSGWYAFYTAREGESTAAMTGAEYAYARALGRRNDRLLKGRSATDRRRILALRKETRAFSDAITGAESARSGGGTIMNLVFSSRAVGGEELIERLVRRRYAGVPARKVSDVSGPLASKRWGANPAGQNELGLARKSLARIAAILKGSPRRESDAVLDFCRRLVLTSDDPDG